MGSVLRQWTLRGSEGFVPGDRRLTQRSCTGILATTLLLCFCDFGDLLWSGRIGTHIAGVQLAIVDVRGSSRCYAQRKSWRSHPIRYGDSHASFTWSSDCGSWTVWDRSSSRYRARELVAAISVVSTFPRGIESGPLVVPLIAVRACEWSSHFTGASLPRYKRRFEQADKSPRWRASVALRC